MFDIRIINGTVIDPVAKKLVVANVYIKDGKIAEISRMLHDAKDSINAYEKYVSPGFIDIHTHTDSDQFVGEMLVKQGVTTTLSGNCGYGQRNLSQFFNKAETEGYILNQAQLAGASEIRKRVGQKDAYKPLSPNQIKKAEEELLKDLEIGAAGLSFGLEYEPGTSTEEILSLATICAMYGRPVTVHIRNDTWLGIVALKEMIDISRKTGCRLIISHVVYQFGFGQMRAALNIIDEAVKEGLDIHCDSGMYTSFATLIGSAVFAEGCINNWGVGYDAIVIASGKYKGLQLNREMYLKVREECPMDVGIAMIGNPHEIPLAFELPYMMCSSDAGVSALSGVDVAVHPQDAATFGKFLRDMVVLTKKLTLVDAISRITSIPANVMGYNSKGRLIKGMDADIVVFDLNKVNGIANFPHLGEADAVPKGFNATIIGGNVVVRDGNLENTKIGKTIRETHILWQM